MPTLDRTKIDPQLFERRFDQLQGLAKLLLLEFLQSAEARTRYCICASWKTFFFWFVRVWFAFKVQGATKASQTSTCCRRQSKLLERSWPEVQRWLLQRKVTEKFRVNLISPSDSKPPVELMLAIILPSSCLGARSGPPKRFDFFWPVTRANFFF